MSDKKYNDDFETKLLGFPSVGIPEDEKNEKYHRDWSKGMYSEWYNGRAAIPHKAQKAIDELRQYGRGEQDVYKYLKSNQAWSTASQASNADRINTSSKEWLREGKSNLDLKIISVAPKVKSMIKAYLSNIREDVMVDSIDPISGARKDQEKYKLYLYAQNKEFFDQYMQKAGLNQEEPEFIPETLTELNMYDEAGGFKPIDASNIEKLVQYSLEMSGYEDQLEDELYNDLMDIGIACTKKKLDEEDKKFKDTYVDPKYLIVQHSRHLDFRDIDWVGHVEFYTIGQLRQLMPDATEEMFRKMAESYSGKLNNPGEFKKHSVVTESGGYGYDGFSVAVFEAEWKDMEYEEAVFYDNKRGKTTKLPVTEETTKSLGSRKRHVKSNLSKLRKASWVVGTDYTFDWGVVNMQERKENNKVVSNYHIMALNDPPLISQMRPILDDLEISYLRWQDARANAVKDGYALNLSKLRAIGQGKDKMNVFEILHLWKTKGLLLYQDSIDGEYKGGKTLPIDKLPTTLLDEIQEFSTSWDHALKMMEDLTGINALILGAAPDPDAPVTTQKLSVASSANAIKPLGMALSAIKRKSAESFMRRFVLACKAREDIIESYSGVIGDQGIKALMKASKSMVDYGMSFDLRPTDAEKAELYRSIELSQQNRREGRPGIDTQTAMRLKRWVQSGRNIKMLEFYLGAMEKRIARQDQMQKEKMINLQADRNDRSAQIAAQSEQQKEGMKYESASRLEGQKAQNDIMRTLIEKDEGVADQAARRLGLKSDQNPQIGAP